MDVERGCGLDDSVSTRLVVIGSRRMAFLAGRHPSLDSVGRVSRRSYSVALAQPGLGPQGIAAHSHYMAGK